MEGLGIIFILAIVAVTIILMRFIGAWMLRIDEVISEQKKTNQLLKELLERNK